MKIVPLNQLFSRISAASRKRRALQLIARAADNVCLVENLEERRLMSANFVLSDSVSPTTDATLDFGNQIEAVASANQTFTLQNTGDAAINVSNFLAGGTDVSDYTITVKDGSNNTIDTSSAFMIAAGQSDTVNVVFTPGAAGTRNAGIDFNQDAPNTINSAVALSMTGVGVSAPALTATDSDSNHTDGTLHFADTVINLHSTGVFTLANSGGAPLHVTNFAKSGQDAGDFAVVVKDNNDQIVNSPSSFTIPVGESYTANVTFTPSDTTDGLTADLTFNTDDPDNASNSLTMVGNGEGPPPADPTSASTTSKWANKMRVNWVYTDDTQDGFVITMSRTQNGTYKPVATAAADARAVQVLGLAPFTEYFFKIAAVNDNGESNDVQTSGTTLKAADANNTPATATDLGAFTGFGTIRNFVGDIDTTDFYKFSIPDGVTAGVHVDVTTDVADVRVGVFKQVKGGKLSGVAEATRHADEPQLALALTGGTYYARVLQDGDDTGYDFNINVDFAGNSIKSARRIGLGHTTIYQESVGVHDATDYYRIVLGKSTTIHALLYGLRQDDDLYLLDSDGNTVASSENDARANESFTHQVAAGVYFIAVVSFEPAGDTGYHLSLQGT